MHRLIAYACFLNSISRLNGEPGEQLEETESQAAITENFGDSASEYEDEGGGGSEGGEEGEEVEK